EVTFSATAQDAVDGPVAVTCAPRSGSWFPLGDTLVECEATDTAGNRAEGSFTVTVTLYVPVERRIAAGAHHTCAVVDDGTVWCWGSHIALGGGASGNSNRAVAVPGLSGVVAVTATWYSTCALVDDGSVWCWGQNNRGQLGNGSTADSLEPVQVAGLADAVSIDGAAEHVCASLRDGTVRCWGSNEHGALGVDLDEGIVAPVGVTDAVAIDSLHEHTCALLRDGAVQCWGDNVVGQRGDGTCGGGPPRCVLGLDDAVSIGVRANHTSAVLGDGTARCWGQNLNSALGVDGIANS